MDGMAERRKKIRKKKGWEDKERTEGFNKGRKEGRKEQLN